ncbi:MAG TPA: hypothetical protein VGM66_04575 [Candidatus Udaeobacter sp.]|jgi:hypothetical protein
MNIGATALNARHTLDQTLMTIQEMERYCAAHPNSPVAIRQPRLSIRGRTFVALLGPSIEEGIAGFGDTVQAALRAFDLQYSRSLTPADRD